MCRAKSKGENVLEGGESILNVFGNKREQGMLEDWRNSVWPERKREKAMGSRKEGALSSVV